MSWSPSRHFLKFAGGEKVGRIGRGQPQYGIDCMVVFKLEFKPQCFKLS